MLSTEPAEVSNDVASGLQHGLRSTTPPLQTGSSDSWNLEASAVVSTAAASAAKSPYSRPELEDMLRNYRMRRRCGLVPSSSSTRCCACSSKDWLHPLANVSEPGNCDDCLRWIREERRPWRFGGSASIAGLQASSDATPSSSSAAAARAAEVAELQQRVERGFTELNSERRAHAGLAEGLRRQQTSADAIGAESSGLRERLEEVRGQIRERTVQNGVLARELGQRRIHHANANTQAALLASAVDGLAGSSTSATVGSVTLPAEDVAGASMTPSLVWANVNRDTLLNEVHALRLHATALVEENEVLSRRLMLKTNALSADAASPLVGPT